MGSASISFVDRHLSTVVAAMIPGEFIFVNSGYLFRKTGPEASRTARCCRLLFIGLNPRPNFNNL